MDPLAEYIQSKYRTLVLRTTAIVVLLEHLEHDAPEGLRQNLRETRNTFEGTAHSWYHSIYHVTQESTPTFAKIRAEYADIEEWVRLMEDKLEDHVMSNNTGKLHEVSVDLDHVFRDSERVARRKCDEFRSSLEYTSVKEPCDDLLRVFSAAPACDTALIRASDTSRSSEMDSSPPDPTRNTTSNHRSDAYPYPYNPSSPPHPTDPSPHIRRSPRQAPSEISMVEFTTDSEAASANRKRRNYSKHDTSSNTKVHAIHQAAFDSDLQLNAARSDFQASDVQVQRLVAGGSSGRKRRRHRGYYRDRDRER